MDKIEIYCSKYYILSSPDFSNQSKMASNQKPPTLCPYCWDEEICICGWEEEGLLLLQQLEQDFLEMEQLEEQGVDFQPEDNRTAAEIEEDNQSS